MKLHTAPQNRAVFSNVQKVSEFKIRQSAKAFSILSSGLYANKIRAIIRELSCNALDSHKSVGKENVPFDLHLPTTLEPWFSLRDYGSGLDHDQVDNIYTTYFESTKTDSDDFIGALGLGSKSPFSYTDNFTVTAIKNGIKGIYSAFINEHGVPSIVQMITVETDEENGVEVKFSVNDHLDFRDFETEALYVFKYFKTYPNLTGRVVEFSPNVYKMKNIVPGVHQVDSYYNCSYAVMGNIPYPINIPNSQSVLGDLHSLLRCGLELEFEIGELDFQASREGLSYIPQTVNAITEKLQLLNDNLTSILTKEANEIENLWERANFLKEKASNNLWSGAVSEYVKNTDFKLFNYRSFQSFKLTVEELNEDFNIDLTAYNFSSYRERFSLESPSCDYAKDLDYWQFITDLNSKFVINDIKRGVLSRIKQNFSHSKSSFNAYVITAHDSSKPVKLAEFFKEIYNPPESIIYYASALEKAPTKKKDTVNKSVSILRLDKKSYSDYTKVWRDAGSIDLPGTDTVYYVPLNGFTMISDNFTSAKELLEKASSLSSILGITTEFFGVRKAELEKVKQYPNWVNYEDYLKQVISSIDDRVFYGMALGQNTSNILSYGINYLNLLIKMLNPHPKSMYITTFKKLIGVRVIHCDEYEYKKLFTIYGGNLDRLEQIRKELAKDEAAIKNRYPLMDYMSGSVPANLIADYINIIDNSTGE